MSDWNSALIDYLRSHDGEAPDGPFKGRQLLILTTNGAKSGETREAPLVYSTDGDRLVIIASMGGAPSHPAWYHNIVADPHVTIEAEGQKFEGDRDDRGPGRTAAPVRPARGTPPELHRVRGQDRRSGHPGHHRAA